jgi:hypothetical protein
MIICTALSTGLSIFLFFFPLSSPKPKCVFARLLEKTGGAAPQARICAVHDYCKACTEGFLAEWWFCSFFLQLEQHRRPMFLINCSQIHPPNQNLLCGASRGEIDHRDAPSLFDLTKLFSGNSECSAFVVPVKSWVTSSHCTLGRSRDSAAVGQVTWTGAHHSARLPVIHLNWQIV